MFPMPFDCKISKKYTARKNQFDTFFMYMKLWMYVGNYLFKLKKSKMILMNALLHHF
jgi:hypothetical protein